MLFGPFLLLLVTIWNKSSCALIAPKSLLLKTHRPYNRGAFLATTNPYVYASTNWPQQPKPVHIPGRYIYANGRLAYQPYNLAYPPQIHTGYNNGYLTGTGGGGYSYSAFHPPSSQELFQITEPSKNPTFIDDFDDDVDPAPVKDEDEDKDKDDEDDKDKNKKKKKHQYSKFFQREDEDDRELEDDHHHHHHHHQGEAENEATDHYQNDEEQEGEGEEEEGYARHVQREDDVEENDEVDEQNPKRYYIHPKYVESQQRTKNGQRKTKKYHHPHHHPQPDGYASEKIERKYPNLVQDKWYETQKKFFKERSSAP